MSRWGGFQEIDRVSESKEDRDRVRERTKDDWGVIAIEYFQHYA